MLIKILRWVSDHLAQIIGPEKICLRVKNIMISEKVKIRIYRPNKDEHLPVLIFYHGGGWIIGSIKSYDRILRYLSYFSKSLIVAVEYRKAPEHKYPTAVNDACAGCSWVLDNIERLGGDITRIGLIGDSAGGNIAIQVAKKIKFKFNYMILIYPVVNITIDSLAKLKSEKSLLMKISYLILDYCLKQYLPSKEQIELISSAKYYTPRMFILKAGTDILSPMISDYVSSAQKKGVQVCFKSYNKTLHGFLKFSGISEKGRTALDDIATFIRDVNDSKISYNHDSTF